MTLRGYLARMPDIRRLQEEAVRITVQEDGDNREQVLFRGIIQSGAHVCGERGVSGNVSGSGLSVETGVPVIAS